MKEGPEHPYSILCPDDMFIVDYFVHEMRELLPRFKQWDVLQMGTPWSFVQAGNSGSAAGLFRWQNMNFADSTG